MVAIRKISSFVDILEEVKEKMPEKILDDKAKKAGMITEWFAYWKALPQDEKEKLMMEFLESTEVGKGVLAGQHFYVPKNTIDI